MEESVSDVVKTHPEVRKRVENYRATVEDRTIARAEYLPVIDAQTGIGYKDYNGPNTLFTDDTYKTSESFVRLRQNLFQGFGSLHNIRRQDARLDSAQYYLMESVSNIGLDIVEAHLEVLKRQKLLQLARENLENHKRIYAMIKERTDSGAGPVSDFEQSSGRLALANSNMKVEINNYEDALATYERLSGEPAVIADMAEPNLTGSTLPENIDLAIEQALQNHPSALVSQKNIAAAKEAYSQSSETLYPWVDLEAKKEWERGWEHDSSAFDQDRDEFSIMLIASWNLYNGGADMAAKAQALSEVFSNTESLLDIKRALKEQLQLSWAAKIRLTQQMDYLEMHRDFSRKTVESYNEEFRVGRRTLLDLLDVEIEFYTARKEYEAARYDQIFAEYRIVENTGGLPQLLNIKIDEMIALQRHESNGSEEQTEQPVQNDTNETGN